MSKKKRNTDARLPKRRLPQSEPPGDDFPGTDRPPALPSGVIRAGSLLPEEEGVRFVREVAEQSHQIRHGDETVALEEMSDLEENRRKIACSERDRYAEELARTSEWIPGARPNAESGGGSNHANISFWHWQPRHQVSVIGYGTAALVALGCSWISVKASLQDSGLPIFINEPMLAAFMAAIAPTASIAIKSVGSLVKHESAKKKIRTALYLMATLSFVGWVALFSTKFEGLSGDFDPFAAPDPVAGQAFTMLQIITEVLVGAALFMNLEAITAIYSPEYFTANLRHEQLTERKAALDAEINALTENLQAARGRLTELNAIRDLTIAAAELALREHRARFGDGLI